MLRIGDIVNVVEITDRKPKSWIITLKKDEKKSTHLGRIDHNNLIGLRYGQLIRLTRGKAILLKPSPRDFLVSSFKLKTQILYADDCTAACSVAGVKNGMKVGEAGSGSGALTLFLAWGVSPDGHVFSFDINENHLENAKENIHMTGLDKYVTFSCQDIRESFDSPVFDAFFLDFSAPFDAIDSIALKLTGGGSLVVFVPNWGQVEETVTIINKNKSLELLEVFEITRRNFIVKPDKRIMRPTFRDIVYSGILIHAIKTIPEDLS
jgi:tRNA (adenine57-N1/adenine58-N1)-methyltransferase